MNRRAEPALSGNDTAPSTSGVSSARVYQLLGLVLVGFLLLITLHQVTGYLIGELNRKADNEQARLSLGEILINDLVRIESSVYKMATVRGVRGQDHARTQAEQQIGELREALRVLDQGGVLQRTTQLNIHSQDRMVRTVEYYPDERESRYVLEVIDLWPKLAQVEGKIEHLSHLLVRHTVTTEENQGEAHLEVEAEIKGFLRSLPPLFTRMNENANRLFFESRRRLDAMETDLHKRRDQYTLAELLLTVAIVVAVLSLGFLILRQVAASNRRLRETGEQMAAAREAAEEANRAKSNFLANMSHELRTPMNAVLGYAQLMQLDDQLSDSHREDVGQILKSGNHLLDLINDVLDLSKVEAGHLKLERIEFPLAELVEEIARTYAPQAHAKGLELIVATSPALPPLSVGDPTRLRQVLINLVGNAIKFTERGEIRLTARPDDGEEVRFEVQDSGIGIPQESRDRLFRPFTQGDESMTRRFGGTGLGLVLTKELVEAMGGRLELESEPDQGTLFIAHLPLPAGEPFDKPTHGGLEDRRVLVASDNAAIRAAIGEQLHDWGVNQTDTPAGVGALSLLRAAAANAPYDWLIIDQRLHDMQGLELARMVHEAHDLTPRMLLLTTDTPPEEAELNAAGIERRLTKPVTSSALREVLLTAPPAPIDTVSEQPPTPSPEGPPNLIGRVLLVEDNTINRQVATGMLIQFGLEVVSAEDGVEALEKLAEARYDVVLMDVQMPRMDGYEATRQLRQRERESGAKPMVVIAMTANAMVGDREKCLEAGMDDHLPKPVEMKALRGKLEYWMSRA